MGEVRFTILGSGSGGNAAFLETSQTRVLIDCGFSARQLQKRLSTIDRTLDQLDAILITHEHTDHIGGLRAVAAQRGIPVYCNRQTSQEIGAIHHCAFDFRLFETGQSFAVGNLDVETFALPHDAIDPVGFLLRTPSGRIAMLTDLGQTTRLIAERVRPAHVLVLETNHDVDMLRYCPHRPWPLKQRILGRHGHLSNEGAADFLPGVVHADLHHIYCAHLSAECNTPELARGEVAGALRTLGATHVQLAVASQHQPCPTLVLNDGNNSP